jgi:polysaccharide export outer membrane protein
MRTFLATTALALALLVQGVALAQPDPARMQVPKPTAPTTQAAAVRAVSVDTEPGFTIGPDDVLGILFWKDQEMSGDVTVRPDGMITLPLIRDLKAAGLTPNQLADLIQKAAREYVTDASVTVVVRQINSRRVFITGEVARPGVYPLASSMTVMQLIALAGGLTEFADGKHIVIMRAGSDAAIRPAGERVSLAFNYNEVAERRNLKQNIELRPGDTVVVPER